MKILTMLSKYQFIKSALLVVPLGLLSSFTFAQNNSASNPALSYPTKPIKFIVAFAPGGPADIIARLLGQKLGEAFAQAVVIENKAGAGGNIASLTVAKAPPDGYTVLVNTSSLAVNESLLKNPGFDAERDLVVASIVASSPNLLVSYPGLKAKTLQEVVAMGPEGHLNFGTAGAGTTPHLTAEYLLNVLAKVKATHIPFQGATPALQAAMAGQTELASVALPAGVELVKSGRVRGLAVTSAKRNTSLPDVPTLSESGYPGFVDYTWVGLFFPAKTPVEIIKKMNEQTAAVLKNPDFLSKLDAVGFEGVGGSPAQAHEYLRAELVKWAKVVKETGVRIE
jgi:tripartite-type tricarboxylate transporter receptor subunit TctC